jgi:hypothetical protein
VEVEVMLLWRRSVRAARPVTVLILAAAVIVTPVASARSSGDGSVHSSSSHSATYHSDGQPKAMGVTRDSHGRIARNPHAKEAFRRSHPCPATGKTYGACPGWVVDHVQALKHGGADDPGNMQWQTREAAKIKDRTE